MIINEQYEIKKTTLAVMRCHHVEYQTLILDEEGEFLTSKSPERLFEEACLKHGSSYEGRKQAVVHMLKYWKRTPFAISPFHGIYVFPTASPRDFDCVWLFSQRILCFIPHPANDEHSVVKFRNGQELVVKVRANFLKSQYARTGACFLMFGPLDGFHPQNELH